ncbi:MAG TPA: 5'/3'-nucleotidase SurE, partial [Acidimicrobiia bacterium]|nr:5'/3'-nucleotidase SurE [Acidimicrobiia bacterium]
DGIDSPGLRVLASALSDWFEVVVAAPGSDMSGAGTGIGRFHPDKGVDMKKVTIDDGFTAYAIDGPPGLAVTAAALGVFGPKPDMVVSGINAGINTGHSIIHSGTVGAALTARTFNMKGLAISLAQSDPWHWETAARYVPQAARWLVQRREQPQVLNINVPGVPEEDIAGVHWADLDEVGYIRVATHDIDGQRLQLVVGPIDDRSDPGSDTVLCSENYVTVTPLQTVEPGPFPDVEVRAIFDTPVSSTPLDLLPPQRHHQDVGHRSR